MCYVLTAMDFVKKTVKQEKNNKRFTTVNTLYISIKLNVVFVALPQRI